MHYYKVDMIGEGTKENPFKPDIQEDVPFVWSTNICEGCGTYIMGSNLSVLGLEEIADLSSACASRDLNIDDVSKWFVGGN